MTRVLGSLFAALFPKTAEASMTEDWRTPINMRNRPEPHDEIVPARPAMPDIKGFDKEADRERRWRVQGPGELRVLIPFMESAGVYSHIIAHARAVLADMEGEVARKYGSK